MMIRLVYVLCTLALAASLFPALAAQAVPKDRATIRLTGTLLQDRVTFLGPAHTYALYNRPAYENQLGFAFLRCVTMSKGWLDCHETVRLQRGTIVAEAVVPEAAGYRTLAVTGGTGIYRSVGGEMIVQQIGDGQALSINLQGF